MNPTSSSTSTQILVRKASGENQPFASQKLEQSLRKAGADEFIINEIVKDITAWLYSGVTTKMIYSRAFMLLKKRKNSAGLRYKIKQAMAELGPTGFPFEHFVGRLFEKQGYEVQTGQIIRGNCVSHEVDVIATKGKHQHLMECKYHVQGKHITVQIPLYVRSRMDDIIRHRKEDPDYSGFTFTGWVVTNTRLSDDSIDFGTCSGLKLLAWDYPAGNGLKELIERQQLYPITILSQITRKIKQSLLDHGIVTCLELLENPNLLDPFDLPRQKIRAIRRELRDLCGEDVTAFKF